MQKDHTNHEALKSALPQGQAKARRRARIDPDPQRLRAAGEPVLLLVFVDFDGVLHPSKGEEGAFCHLSRLSQCADELASDGVSVSFVISSSWRCFAPLGEILDAMEAACPGFGSRVEGSTGARPADPLGSRRLEIYDYLRSRPGGAPKAFVAIDDRLDLFGGEALAPHWLLLTCPERCFDDASARGLKELAKALLALPAPGPAWVAEPLATPSKPAG